MNQVISTIIEMPRSIYLACVDSTCFVLECVNESLRYIHYIFSIAPLDHKINAGSQDYLSVSGYAGIPKEIQLFNTLELQHDKKLWLNKVGDKPSEDPLIEIIGARAESSPISGTTLGASEEDLGGVAESKEGDAHDVHINHGESGSNHHAASIPEFQNPLNYDFNASYYDRFHPDFAVMPKKMTEFLQASDQVHHYSLLYLAKLDATNGSYVPFSLKISEEVDPTRTTIFVSDYVKNQGLLYPSQYLPFLRAGVIYRLTTPGVEFRFLKKVSDPLLPARITFCLTTQEQDVKISRVYHTAIYLGRSLPVEISKTYTRSIVMKLLSGEQ